MTSRGRGGAVTSRGRGAAIAIGLCLVFASASARADVARARAALEAGDATAALTELGDDDATEPCLAGRAHHALGDLPRALVYLERCHDAGAEDPAARRARRELRRAAADGDFAPVMIDAAPAGASVVVEPALAGVPLGDSSEIWLAPGRYRLRATAPGHLEATQELSITGRDRVTVRLVLEVEPGAPDAATTTVDFGDEGAAVGEIETAPDLRPKKRPSLLPDRYQRAPDPPARPADDAGPSRTLPWLVTGVGVVAIAAGGALHLGGDGDDHTGAYLLYGAGAAITGLGVFLVVRDPDRPAPALSTGAGTTTVGVSGRF